MMFRITLAILLTASCTYAQLLNHTIESEHPYRSASADGIIYKPANCQIFLWTGSWTHIQNNTLTWTPGAHLASEIAADEQDNYRSKYEFTYNPSGYLLTQIISDWMNQNWNKLSKYSYEYDTSNRETKHVKQNFNSSTQEWGDTVFCSRIIYTDNGIYPTEVRYQSFNSNRDWEDSEVTIYEWNGSHLSRKINQYFQSGIMTSTNRTTWAYGTGTVPNEGLHEYWNGSAWDTSGKSTQLTFSSWDPIRRTFDITRSTGYSYVNDTFRLANRLEKTYYQYGSYHLKSEYYADSFTLDYEEIKSYDQYGNLLLNEEVHWSWGFNGYTPDTSGSRNLLTYGANGEVLEWIYQERTGSAGYKNKTKFIYSNFSPYVNVEELKKTSSSVYPNPACDVLFTGIADEHEVSVYDINGRELQTLKTTDGKIKLDAFLPGLYIFKITSATGVRTEKVIVDPN